MQKRIASAGENRRSPWMNTEQLAEYLGLRVETVRTMVKEPDPRKRIPFSRIGSRKFIRFHRERVDKWLLKREERPRRTRRAA